jgi:uncharacterized protein YbaP (TraB family)
MSVRLRLGAECFAGAPLRLTLALAAVFTAAFWAGVAAPAAAEPALWKVRGPAATVYLFGTVHVLKPGLAWRSAKIDRALEASGSLWLEIADPGDTAAMQPLVMKYGFDPAHPLSTTLDPATRTRLYDQLVLLGVDPAKWAPMRPWMAGLALDVLPLAKAGYAAGSGVEIAIRRDAVQAGKPVAGLETAEDQIRYLADAPEAEQIELLKSSIDDAEKGPGEIDALVAAWTAGDEDAIEAHMNADLRRDHPWVYRTLIVERNRRFAARIADLAAGRGSGGHRVIFVAVGAAHLVGPDSVEADLAGLGLTAVRQ